MEIEYDKDRARKKFEEANVDWNKKKKLTPFVLSANKLEMLIELYPNGDNTVIAETLEITYSQLISLVSRLRKEGVLLKKSPREDLIQKRIIELKKQRPDLFK